MAGPTSCTWQLKVMVCYMLMTLSVKGFCGGFFSTPSKKIHTEKIWSGKRFDFIITATNFPGLQGCQNLMEEGGAAVALNFQFSPVQDEDLMAAGYWYSGDSSISLSGGLVRTMLRETRFLIGLRNMHCRLLAGSDDQGTSCVMQGKVMPIWGLASFLENSGVLGNLYRAGFMSPAMVSEPTLTGSYQYFQMNYLGFPSLLSGGAISTVHIFGVNPTIVDQFQCSIEGRARPEGFIDPELRSRQIIPFSPNVQSNIVTMTRQFGENNFFFFIGLTRSGKWGYLAVIFNNLYLEAIRKDLCDALKKNKDDFDPPPSGAGAAGGLSGTVY